MLKYEGLFFEDDMFNLIKNLEENKLDVINDILHCTFKYHPNSNEIFNDIVGKSFDIYLIGYGSNSQNSGFEILLPEELKKYYINYDEKNPTILKTPHITASIAKGAKAVNTKDLDFKPLKKPIKLTGKFGYWIEDEMQEYLSYNPYYD